MNASYEILHTRYTNSAVFRHDALSYAQEIYGSFTDFESSERLARLGLNYFGTPIAELSAADLHSLYSVKCISSKDYEVPLNECITPKGLVAINMVGVEVVDRDMEMYLREPFSGMEILDMIHTITQTRCLEIK